MLEENIIHKKSAGGIVCYSKGKILTLNVTKYGEIVFPKGAIEPGYHVKVRAPLGEVSYEFDEDDGKRYRKTVYHYLLELVDENETPEPNREEHENDEGIENLWLSIEDARKHLTHEDSRQKLEDAITLLRSFRP